MLYEAAVWEVEAEHGVALSLRQNFERLQLSAKDLPVSNMYCFTSCVGLQDVVPCENLLEVYLGPGFQHPVELVQVVLVHEHVRRDDDLGAREKLVVEEE